MKFPTKTERTAPCLHCVICSIWLSLLLLKTGTCMGQDIYASGLKSPMGIAFDAKGWLWVANLGSGNDDGDVSVVTAEGKVYSFLEGLPSGINAVGEVTGANHVYFDENDYLLIVQGEGTDPLSQSILVVDTSSFSPGDPPRTPEDIEEVYNIGNYVFDQGFDESNPFTLTYGPESDLYIVDAAANAIIRRNKSTGAYTVFATFADISNATGIGPPMVNAVPTEIVYTNDKFYVGALTGFPFADGAARIYEVDLEGNVSIFKTGLTTVVGLTVDPGDGNLVALQYADFQPPPPFKPNSGKAVKFKGEELQTLAEGLHYPVGIRFADTGDLLISTLTDGNILKVPAHIVTSMENLLDPSGFEVQNYPNPFHHHTTIKYQLSARTPVVLKVYDLLGKELQTLVDQVQSTGKKTVVWEGSNEAGEPMPEGIYIYNLRVGSKIHTQKMFMLK